MIGKKTLSKTMNKAGSEARGDHRAAYSMIDILAKADETYSILPAGAQLEIERIAKRMPDFGQRQLRRAGIGSEPYDFREYREGLDDPRLVSAKLSMRHEHLIVGERQAETRHPTILWRKGRGTTAVRYSPNRYTKKEFLDIAFLAYAKAAAKGEDSVGVLGTSSSYSGHAAMPKVASKLMDVNFITGDFPVVRNKIPPGSTVILGSDFLLSTEEEQIQMIEALKHFQRIGVDGRICMVLDPVERDLGQLKGFVQFNDIAGDLPLPVEKVEAIKEAYAEKINKYIDWFAKLTHSMGYKFIIESTASQPVDLVLKMLRPAAGAPAPLHGPS